MIFKIDENIFDIFSLKITLEIKKIEILKILEILFFFDFQYDFQYKILKNIFEIFRDFQKNLPILKIKYLNEFFLWIFKNFDVLERGDAALQI